MDPREDDEVLARATEGHPLARAFLSHLDMMWAFYNDDDPCLLYIDDATTAADLERILRQVVAADTGRTNQHGSERC